MGSGASLHTQKAIHSVPLNQSNPQTPRLLSRDARAIASPP